MFGLVGYDGGSREVVKVYVYHPETHEHIRAIDMCKDEYEYQLSNGACITDKEPLAIDYGNQCKTSVFNKEKDCWELLDDYRSFKYNSEGEKIERKSTVHDRYRGYYLPLEGDEPDSPRRFNDTFGPLPEGAITKELPSRRGMVEALMETNLETYINRIRKHLKMTKNSNILVEHHAEAVSVSPQPDGTYFGVVTYDTIRNYLIEKFILDRKLDTLSRAHRSEVALKAASLMLDVPYEDALDAVNSILDEADILLAVYSYYNNYISGESLPYKTLYVEYYNYHYDNGDKKYNKEVDYDRLKVELGFVGKPCE